MIEPVRQGAEPVDEIEGTVPRPGLLFWEITP
jgi:hypothetical protein